VASTLGNSLVNKGQVDEGFRYLKQAIIDGGGDQDDSGWKTLALSLGMKVLVERADVFKSSRQATRFVPP
jgi:hypothetical protein